AVRPGRIHRALQGACEALVGGVIAANVIVIGASFGAYGTRMVRTALPHGPLEVAPYSLALGLYLQGRRRPPPARHVLPVAALPLVGNLLLALRRTCRRRARSYALYQLHLSTHDQAKGQDLEDMVEQIANLVRAWPADRARNGQPYVALELICGASDAPGRGQ